MAGDGITHPLLVTLQRAGTGVPALLCAALASAEEIAEDGTASPMMVEVLTYLLGATAVAIVLATVVSVMVLVRRARDQREREALDEARFGSEVLRTLKPYGSGGLSTLTPSLGTAEGGAPVLDIVQNPNAAGPETAGRVDNAGALQEVLAQLRRANLLNGFESYLELHGRQKGMAAVTLRGGKTALVVPHLESEGFTIHQLGRYDFIICANEAGRPVLIQPLAEYIASRFTM